MKRIKPTLFLGRKTFILESENLGEPILIQKIGRTLEKSGDSRKNWETWTICCRTSIFSSDIKMISYFNIIINIIMDPALSRVPIIFIVFFSHHKFFVKIFFHHFTTIFTFFDHVSNKIVNSIFT